MDHPLWLALWYIFYLHTILFGAGKWLKRAFSESGYPLQFDQSLTKMNGTATVLATVLQFEHWM